MDDRALLSAALAREADAQRALLAGEDAAPAFAEAAAHYRASWEAAGPRAFGRLVGMLKASVLAGDAADSARYARSQIAEADSPPSAYALAIAALICGEDAEAAGYAAAMRGGGPAFERAADAIEALARRDAERYAAALADILADFEARDAHLTGVAFADTALLLERLAAPRGMARRPASPLLPR